eukprot:scaffold14902_cov81-Skeletonema_dohrnii-CCMP3373.AAC.1
MSKGDLTWLLEMSESAVVFLLREVVQSWASFSQHTDCRRPGTKECSASMSRRATVEVLMDGP